MPSTYLLLRNNKQTGPHSLEALLQQGLKSNDLIWVEGQSAGWSYPSEIRTLKQYVTNQSTQPENSKPNSAPQTAIATTKTEKNKQLHIYVSLPNGRTSGTDEMPTAASLEQKAEALYQRVQAFAEGRETEDVDTRYARSLDDMKQEYGSWLVQQQKKKKFGSLKKKVWIAASVLVVTTTGFGVNKWISHKSNFKNVPLATYALSTSAPVEKKQAAITAYNVTANPFTRTDTTALQNEAVNKNVTKPAGTHKKQSPPKLKILLPRDTAKQAAVPVIEKPAEQNEVKKVVALSRLLSVSGALQNENTNRTGTQVVLQNNSAELLKSVAINITYFKKEDRQLSKETIYFYNVLPGSAPTIQAAGSRRATSAHFEIGTIIRGDGSLYLIH